jgi:hypothetical protein
LRYSFCAKAKGTINIDIIIIQVANNDFIDKQYCSYLFDREFYIQDLFEV